MAFDPTQPTDTTKIRNLGIVIRPNWVAIQEADSTFKPHAINFIDRTVAGLPVNPTALADTFISFCKTDTAGNSEFFGIDEDSNVIQYSYGGRMGGPATNISFVNFRFGSDTTNYTRNNIIVAYGRFNDDGTSVVANNCSFTRTALGIYRVTLNPVATNQLYVPMVSVNNQGGNARIARITIVSVSQFDISVVNEDGNARDCGVFFHVCGGF